MAITSLIAIAVLGRTALAANYVGGQCVVGVTSGDLFPDSARTARTTVAADFAAVGRLRPLVEER